MKTAQNWHPEPTDMEVVDLVRRAQAGDKESCRVAVGDLFERFKMEIFKILLARLHHREEDAWDLVQDVFVAVLKHISQVRDPQRFESWLKQTAYNRLRHFFSQDESHQKKIEQALKDLYFNGKSSQQSGEPLPERNEIARILRRLVASLKPAYQTVLRQFYFDHESLIEIGRNLGKPVGTVKRRLHDARELLRIAIHRRGYEWN